ncbi:hypothetical protein ACFWYW_58920 [Nonomuraea sp. NPDC059023]|uniref:hypothetical protein n=1 Tax=unclassified Nonomuraea TaxID=2593643 RepID=UPI0036848F4C
MSGLPNLADLPEPDDGSMVIVKSDYATRLWIRNDYEANKGLPSGQTREARWFVDDEHDDEPHTWRAIICRATHVWERGPLLASKRSGEAS